MAKINAPRGTADILPVEVWKWQAVEKIAREISELYHFAEIRTPVYEHTELFHRGVGETSDIVQKETFTFRPRPESESITLRPEGTAGVVRAAIENSLIAQEGARAKVYYIGPNFRYERPQKGRLRIHHQFGAEAFGIAAPEQDVECIQLQMDFYARCGVKDLLLQINSLGDAESKARYRDALVAFLQPKAAELSEDSQRRWWLSLRESHRRFQIGDHIHNVNRQQHGRSLSGSLWCCYGASCRCGRSLLGCRHFVTAKTEFGQNITEHSHEIFPLVFEQRTQRTHQVASTTQTTRRGLTGGCELVHQSRQHVGQLTGHIARIQAQLLR